MFSSFSLLGLARYPSGNDMINVQGGEESHATSGLTVWDE